MPNKNIEAKIKKIIAKIEPAILSHGGSIEFVDWDAKKGIVQVKLAGACRGCPMSEMTLKYGLEQALKNKMPSIKEVRSI